MPQDTKRKNGTVPKPKCLGILAVGGCGTKTIEALLPHLDPEENPHLYVLVANTDEAELHDCFVNDGTMEPTTQKWQPCAAEEDNAAGARLRFLTIGDTGNGAGGKPEVGRNAAESKRKEIEAFLDQVDMVIICGGLGGGTGTGGIPVFSKFAREKGKCAFVLVTMPFPFEGYGRLKRAQEAHSELCGIIPTLTVYNAKIADSHKSYPDARKEVTETSILPILLFLRQLILEVGEINLDISDFQTALGIGNHLLFLSAELNSGDGPAEIIARLREKDFQDLAILEMAEYALAGFCGPWGMNEMTGFVRHITHSLQAVSGSENFEVNSGMYKGEGNKSLGMLIVASKPPSREKQEEKVSGMQVLTRVVAEGTTRAIYIVPESDFANNASKEVRVSLGLAARYDDYKSRVRRSNGTTDSRVLDSEFRDLAAEIERETGTRPRKPVVAS